jgi:hypothetical protein
MIVIPLLIGATFGAAVAWWFATQRTAELLTQHRVDAHRELRYWKEAAERANAEAHRLAREAESWSAGCKQGREDVISIVPLLVAAQQRGAEPPGAVDDRKSS